MIDIIVLKSVILYGGADFLSIRLDKTKIEEMMQAFYSLTGIRFVLFDAAFHELTSCPGERCAFCRLMHDCAKTRGSCRHSDRRAFAKCAAADSPIIYHCHAGLVEAVIPLHENETIVGYLIFGQITDRVDKAPILKKLDYWENGCGINRRALESAIQTISCKSREDILAAAKIMEACTSYILYKELITPENSKLLESAREYIDAHLSEDISVEMLCTELRIGRTKLYELFRKELHMGVSKHILKRRMHRAKKLIRTTDLPISEIAATIGFSDYNYFGKVFKRLYGRSPRSYRNT